MLVLAIVTISLALVLYSVGVWGEKISGRLSPLFLGLFWAGFVFDTIGTTLMSDMAGGFTLNLHGLTGAIALVLMLIHAIWATIVLVRKDNAWIMNFHKFSLAVWVIWLVPYLLGAALNARL